VNFSKALFRAWFYFRTGYNTYIAFFIGFASNVIVIYKLGVSENRFLGPYFASLTLFAILALAILIPISISAGLYHMKRTGAYAADASVSIESNPYIYRVIPGKEQEVFLPLWILTVRGLARVLDQQRAMTPEEKLELEDTLSKANALLKGQLVGVTKGQNTGGFPVTQGDQ
jgi:hypothetical protein